MKTVVKTQRCRRGHAGVEWPSVRELEAGCAALAAAVPGFAYGGCQFTLLSCHADRMPAGTVIKPHRHSYYEAILILAGTGHDAAALGRPLESGTLQLHGPGDLHAWSAPRSALLRLGWCFEVQPAVPARLPGAWPVNPEIDRDLQALLAEAASALPGRRERLAARLVLLLAPALARLDLPERPGPAVSPATAPRASGIASFVERFLADNLAEPLTLEDVAAQLNLSVPTLTRRFRQETGESVMARLQGLRLRHAADLLRAGAASVKEVGAAVGIPAPSYFCRCFRRAFGQSPRRFTGAGE